MIKKCISLLSALILAIMCVLPAFADDNPQIYGDKVECKSGEIIDYSVNISNNPGVAACVVGVVCESDWFYFDDEATKGNFTDEGSITCSNDVRFMNVGWYNADDVTGNGTLFNMKVHVSPSTPDGEYPITVMYSKENTVDSKYNEVEFETVDGSITVKHVRVKNTAVDIENNTNADPAIKPWMIVTGVVTVALAIVCFVLIRKNKKTK